ncbi:MAG: metallophosphoesterase [Candidatus Gastranaerophilales bacterium]|nr:metallophosphoesterase [Candidatus Gastranaerophilales bacterium]
MKTTPTNDHLTILLLADQKSKYLYDFYNPENLKDVDLIISCGDLPPEYLSFFVTLCNVPLLYVKGNHDGKYEHTPPEGCICIEDDIYVHQGVRILGLGGSMEYIPGAGNQFTEQKMRRRVRRLFFKLWKHKGFDILVTHAPAYQFNDLPDLPHRGFAVFRELIEKYEPKFFFHGHVHANYSTKFKRRDTLGNTTVVNAFEYHIVEYPMDSEYPTDSK